MRQEQYKRVLEIQLLPQLRYWFTANEQYICIHDWTPYQKPGGLLHSWLILPWPANSLDMKPIENSWELIKRAIAKKVITTKQQLKTSSLNLIIWPPIMVR